MSVLKPPIALLAAALFIPSAACHADELGLGPNPVSPVLVSEVDAVRPGEAFWVGLWIEHPENYHTYWKGSGIVGVPTELTWELPEGFSAGEIEWPVPIRVDMAGYNAHGYHGEHLLMVKITPPDQLNGKRISLKASAVWMCCSKTCHPGYKKVEITLPVANDASKPTFSEKWHPIFEETRTKFPEPLLGWKVTAKETKKALILSITPDKKSAPDAAPNPGATSIYFFSEDNHVNSASPQAIRRKPDGTLVLTMERSPFGDSDAKSYPGLLYCEQGWLKDGKMQYGQIEVPRTNPKPFPIDQP